MAPLTRSQTRQSKREDGVDQCGMLPAFVTAPVPPMILDELIDESWEGAYDLTSNQVPPSDCLCILTTENLDSIKHGSRKPMQPFESPFLGMTDEEVRTWFNEHPHPNFACRTFSVLDRDTARNKTCRIGNKDGNEEAGNKMITTDFYASTYTRIPLEAFVFRWFEDVESIELQTGPGKVYTRKHIEKEKREVAERVAQGL
ncbi:hypothetical protein V496_04896 [Pseudogymnoascus sp. VKM F-4515 (FW-2607)]|nr:hypothetical protein V496_04896 [Pseudogymnoascus sp. VKM F-4515 (FW-2607)]KFY89710.1 hypothetical protein V498_06315 [Pseudogymnoascus sp. VKM F-4517 (FW-2822)]